MTAAAAKFESFKWMRGVADDHLEAEYDLRGRRHPRSRRADLRCDAVAGPAQATQKWNSDRHRCGNSGVSFRDGRWVCRLHREQIRVQYTCGNYFDALAPIMRTALGDAS
jgi:hypothetical protein